MRRIFIGLSLLVLLPVCLAIALSATGTINSSSLRMILNNMAGLSGPPANKIVVRQRYDVPEGFTLELYAGDIPKARFLRITRAGDLLVSRPHVGDIMLLRSDADGDGNPDAMETLIEGLRRPLGMDISGDWLYIAESNRISRIRFDSNTGRVNGDLKPLVKNLSDNGNHWSKTIRISQDQKLYLAQGSTCNVCKEDDLRRATIMRFELDGSQPEVFATGLRNSVGFDWAPWSDVMYATDNGRDLLGNDTPPDELNQIEQDNFYGWPYFYGNNIRDMDMGDYPLDAHQVPTAPAHNFRAHNAPLGMTFLTADGLPRDFQRSALVALHGSWNRSTPDGYKVVSLHWTAEGIEERDFLTGFNQGDKISGRPVDVAQGPDGAIYISDDYAGAIYRVRYNASEKAYAPAITVPEVNRLDDQLPAWLETANLETMAMNGGELYKQLQCSSCHEEGENPKRLDNLAQRLGYDAVIEALEAPQSPMPQYPLNEMEKRELTVFLLWQPPASD